MSVYVHLTHLAQDLLAAGKKQDANKVLVNILHAEPENVAALFLYQQTLSDPDARKQILEKILRLNPNHGGAQAVLADLGQPPPARGSYQANQRGPQPQIIFEEGKSEKTAKQIENYQWAIAALVVALITTFVGFTMIMSTDSRDLRTVSAEKRALAREYNSLTTAHTHLNQQYAQQSNRLQTLITDHDALNTLYTTVQQELTGAKAELTQLNRRYENLVSQYNELNGRYTTLEQTHNNLTVSYNTLNNSYDTLQGSYNNLYQQYNTLASTSLTPPYIHVTGERTIELVFYRSSGQLDTWTVPFDDLERDIVRGNRDRHSIITALFKRVHLEGLQGANASAPDFRMFVDPRPFHQVVSDVYYESASEYAFVYELWYIVTQLNTYNPEMEETPRYPLETFLAGGGDCEDTAILLASMLKAAPANWEVSLIYMDAYSPYRVIRPNHIMVHLRTGTRDYFIETTSNIVMEPLGQNPPDGWFFPIEG